jgi:MoaA/NifB/PqqE/SkfB family radical SAM enzyme
MDARLRELTLEITRECMNRCMYCSSLAVRHADKPPIDCETVANLVSQAMDLGLHSLAISGGEPFLHPDVGRILRRCAAMRVPRLLVYTSGISRDEKGHASALTPDMLNLARSCDLRLIFNVESNVPAIHDRVVGADGRLRLTLFSLRQALAHGIPVEGHVVPNHQNAETLASTARRLISLGVERVSFLRLVPQGYATETREDIICSDEDETRIREQFQSLINDPDSSRRYRFGVPFSGHCGDPKRCNAGVSKLIMRWDGVFFPCEAFKECGRDELSLGTARDTPLAIALHRQRVCSGLQQLKTRAARADTCPAQCLYLERGAS